MLAISLSVKMGAAGAFSPAELIPHSARPAAPTTANAVRNTSLTHLVPEFMASVPWARRRRCVRLVSWDSDTVLAQVRRPEGPSYRPGAIPGLEFRRVKLSIESLSLAYGPVTALRELTADVSGSVIGLIGATASGKTSLLQILAGQIGPSSGRLQIDGQVVPPGKRGGVAYVPQDVAAFPYFQRPKETMSLALT